MSTQNQQPTPDEPLDVTTALELARQAATDAVAAAGAAEAGQALIPAGADAALAVKTQMATARAGLSHVKNAAVAAQERAKDAIKRQQQELDAQMRAMNAQLAPLMEQIAKLTEGIWTMNLYLGRDEEIHTLATGEPAPAATPIYVRQQVLAMDEETAIAAEDGGIDIRSIEAFDEWLTASPANLDQLLPEKRGVVAIMARRKDRDYGDPWVNKTLNGQNHQTWWLIRNGENLYRMQTDFNAGARLVPARTEFTSMFVDRWSGKPLEPGTQAWMKAEEAAGARERHYMRVALILQGLIDRTAVFAPLPVAGVSLLRPEHYDEGHVVLIADDENQITTGRLPFREWIAQKNSGLTSGMRIAFTPNHDDWPDRGRDRNWGEHERLTPRRAETPDMGIHVLERRGDRGGEFAFLYARTQEDWIGSGRDAECRAPKTRASARVRISDPFILAVDLVTADEIRAYLEARTERHAYVKMFPMLRAALALKEAEAAAEEPFRELLAAHVAQAENVDARTARTLIDPVIATWKVGARWFRPLQGDPAVEARAAREILAERARIARADAGAGDDDAFVARAKREHPSALLIARKKDGTYVVLTPSVRRWITTDDGKAHQAVPQDVWVDRHEYTRTGRPRPGATWQLVAPATISRWITLHVSDSWATWNKTARPGDHIADTEIDDVIARIQARSFEGLTIMAVDYREVGSRWNGTLGLRFEAWYHPGPVPFTPRPLTDRPGYLKAPTITVQVSRNADMTIAMAWEGQTPGGNHVWRPPFNQGITPLRTEQPEVPWHSTSSQVYLDAAVFARAQLDAAAWEARRLETAHLDVTVVALMAGAQDARRDAQLAIAKARFLEDYADETLWEDHAKTVKVDERALHQFSEEPASRAIWHAVRRLVEDGKAPWGLTIAEAFAVLGEPPTKATGPSWEPVQVPIEIPDELLALRLADEPAGRGSV